VQEEKWTMNPSLFEIGVAIVMVTVIIALLVWLVRYMVATSEKRMMRMLKRAGVAPEIATQGDTKAIIDDIRGRCQRCQAEDLCERWLAGDVRGENTFCPNAQLFRMLAKTTHHTA
jgi:hypothetical protein